MPAVVVTLLATVGPAPAGAQVEPATPSGPPPQLLLFHGGSFLYEDPTFEAATEPLAEAAGFVPHYVDYPLGDLPAALVRARAEAARLRSRFGAEAVYAYGSSAGGTLAALLSGEGLVAAAVAKAPPSDLVGWNWPLSTYGADYYEQIGLGEEARYRLSPQRRPQRQPLLLLQGRSDAVVPAAMSEAFAAKFRQVRLWLLAGGHRAERSRPQVVARALRWLLRASGAEEPGTGR
ncbi:MAG TPA: prolyl oligopeptidase family serine peptidase [Solirubrobacterales bacterium]|nr:prolyl oligopeptidase family serine peptidase [Solirubrobacterales bacterium]